MVRDGTSVGGVIEYLVLLLEGIRVSFPSLIHRYQPILFVRGIVFAVLALTVFIAVPAVLVANTIQLKTL